jgi:hypothetical protein
MVCPPPPRSLHPLIPIYRTEFISSVDFCIRACNGPNVSPLLGIFRWIYTDLPPRSLRPLSTATISTMLWGEFDTTHLVSNLILFPSSAATGICPATTMWVSSSRAMATTASPWEFIRLLALSPHFIKVKPAHRQHTLHLLAPTA